MEFIRQRRTRSVRRTGLSQGLALAILAGWFGSAAAAKASKAAADTIQSESLQAYVGRMQQQPAAPFLHSQGSLWADGGRLANLAADYKARQVGDLIVIVITQGTTANSANSVATNRTFNASSSITALAAHASTSAVNNIFSPNSAAALSGKSQAATTTTLQDSLTGRVVAVLPSGNLVVEAERHLTMNNERQTLVLRGLVRIGDIASNGTIASNNLGDLELELKGKGVLSDGVRPPNILVRKLLWLLGF